MEEEEVVGGGGDAAVLPLGRSHAAAVSQISEQGKSQ